MFLAWCGWSALAVTAMWLSPGEETIPYHLAWAGFALVYGLSPWSLGRTVGALVALTSSTGLVLTHHAFTGDIAWEECTEIPLMGLLGVLMVWHVRRRQAALAEVHRLAESERQTERDRIHLMRLTSHELRTPLTITRGYVELLTASPVDSSQRDDLDVISSELDRLDRVIERLVTMMRVQEAGRADGVDVDTVLRTSVSRWSTVADRQWRLSTSVGTVPGTAERLRAALDTMLENAVRHTETGDVIEVVATRTKAEGLRISVSDSGCGLSDADIEQLNQPDGGDPVVGPLSQTGLGLAIVRRIAAERGGHLEVGHSPYGGATFTLVCPPHRVARTSRPAEHR